MGPRDRLPPRYDAFSSAHLAQPSYTTRSDRHAGDFKTACAHGRIQYCNTTFHRIAPLGFFLLPSCTLVFTRSHSISKHSRCHFSSTPSFHCVSPTKPIARFLVVTHMSVAKTFSRTTREGAGPCPAVVCGDVSHSRVAYVQKEERESNLTAMLFSLRELGSTWSCFRSAPNWHSSLLTIFLLRRCGTGSQA